jgi:hypothetical protein
MPVQVLLAAAALLGVYFLVRRLRRSTWSAGPGLRLVMAIGVALLVLLAAVRGGGGAVALPLLALLAPLLLRWIHSSAPSSTDSSRSGQSKVATRFLDMMLDHTTGAMSGQVREGQFAGRALPDLDARELQDLWRDCQADPQSVAVLEAYLDRHGDPDWRDQWRATGPESSSQSSSGAGGPMNRQEAYQVLGLRPDASHEEIRAAYRRLIQRVHPDHGGSSYLAARINQARDVLLEE